MGLSGFTERLVAGRWIAGPGINDAIGRSEHLNSLGMRAIINYLGEAITERSMVEESVGVYIRLLRRMHAAGVRADISIKPTELGMSIDQKLARANYLRLAREAKKRHTFLWMDMEEYYTVDDSIRLYLNAVGMGNVGICIQSYLRRSIGDLERLARHRSVVRLVKGAYSAPKDVAYETRASTTMNYYRLMGYVFDNFARFTIATHDTAIVEKAVLLNKARKRDVTYAMLNGIRNDYALSLVKRGLPVSIYVPFGEQWVKYAYRRFKEMNSLKLVAMSVFTRRI